MTSVAELGEVLLGIGDARDVGELGRLRVGLAQHLAEQAGVARVVLDEKQDPDGRAGHPPTCCGSLTWVSQKSSMLLTSRLEFVEAHGLVEIRVGLELIACQDVVLRLGGGEDDRRDGLEVVVALDLGEDLAAIHPGQVEIEQDEIRARGIRLAVFLPQERHRLRPVGRHVKRDAAAQSPECLERQAHVAWAVLDQQHLQLRPIIHPIVIHGFTAAVET